MDLSASTAFSSLSTEHGPERLHRLLLGAVQLPLVIQLRDSSGERSANITSRGDPRVPVYPASLNPPTLCTALPPPRRPLLTAVSPARSPLNAVSASKDIGLPICI